MIRVAGRRLEDGKPFVILGLEKENIGRLLEGLPIKVNLRNLDPDAPIEGLPDLELMICYAGEYEKEGIKKMIDRWRATLEN